MGNDLFVRYGIKSPVNVISKGHCILSLFMMGIVHPYLKNTVSFSVVQEKDHVLIKIKLSKNILFIYHRVYFSMVYRK